MSQEDEIRSLLRRWGRAVYRIREIERLKEAISRELDTISDVRPQQLSGMPHSTNIGRPTEENAFRRMAAEKNRISDLDEEEKILKRIIEDAEWAVSFVPERERKFLELHYLVGMSMEQVASELYVSRSQAWNIEKKAIRIIIRFSSC